MRLKVVIHLIFIAIFLSTNSLGVDNLVDKKSRMILSKRSITSEAKIAGLYVAYFNRAPDQKGLEFWKNKAQKASEKGKNVSDVLKELSEGFAKHPTFISTYENMNNREFVETIYKNVLSQNGDSEGINYWTNYLNSGNSRSDMVSDFVELSLTLDLTPQNFPNLTAQELTVAQKRQDLITNKVKVALKFTTLLGEHTNVANSQYPENDPAYKASIKILSNVTDDNATVSTAIDFLNSIKDDNDPINRINNPTSTPTPTPTTTKTKGYLIDSPVQGVTYICDGNEGLTDINGTFECIAPPVTFKIGNLTLGTLKKFTSDGKVYPQDILGLPRNNFTTPKLKLLARLLQSLDDDGKIENKITITKEIREAITKKQNIKDMREQEVNLLVKGAGKSFVKECGALKHLGDKDVTCNSDGSYYVYTPPVSTPTPTPTSKIKLLSPQSKSTVEYNYVTLEVDGGSNQTQTKSANKKNKFSKAYRIENIKAKVNGAEYIGVKNGTSFFIYNVPLKKGENSIQLIANGGSEERNVTISSEGKGYAPIGINADKREGFEKLDTTLTVQTKLSVSKYLLDKDNDGIIDDNKTNNSFTLKYTKEGRYFPTVTVKTSNGTLYSTQQNISLDVKAKPTVEVLSSLSSLDIIDMQIFSNEKYYILTSSAVYEINATNDIVNTININANNPEGFFVDRDENIFIANTGANQVIKLSKVNNYQQTMAFGADGSANGEFNQPKDLVVEGSGEQQKIYVLDSGNNRVQVFNYVGAYLYSFDGSNTPTGKLNNPTSMVGYFAQPLTIVDSGNGVIRTLQCTQGQKEHEVSVIKDGISSNIGKITISGNLIVPDKGAKKILFFQNNYWLKKSLGVDKVPNIAISNIATSNDGLDVVVANEGESGLKKYKVKEDPKGAEPMEVAKKFVKALIDGDRASVEKLVGNNPRIIDIIYGNKAKLNSAIDLYKQITSWHSQTYYTREYASVKAHIKTATDEFDATFELVVEDPQIKTSRIWIVKRFY